MLCALSRCRPILLPVFLLFLLAACTVGPKYQRPKTDVPGAYRAVPATAPVATSSESLGDAKWWIVFQDEQLQSLIRTALKQNYDLRIAAERVLAAQAQLRIARSDQYPSAGVGVVGTTERQPSSPFSPSYRWDYMQVGGSASWDIDFWGKYRRATEAARTNLAQTEWGKRAVVSTLVANVASAYFRLRALDLDLEITQRTLASRQESLRLTKLLADQGAASMVDVRQAEQPVYVASATLPDLQRQIEQEENYLSFPLAQNPGPIIRGRSLTEQARPPDFPPTIRVLREVAGSGRAGRLGRRAVRIRRGRPQHAPDPCRSVASSLPQSLPRSLSHPIRTKLGTPTTRARSCCGLWWMLKVTLNRQPS